MRALQVDERIQQLLQDAALFSLLAQSFYYPESKQQAAVSRRFAQVCSTQTQRGQIKPLRKQIKAAQRAWEIADAALLEAEYIRLFLSDAPCPLHETAYGDGRRIAGRAVELADIQGFYTAFGFALANDNPDLPDHLYTELEFYSLLLIKQAYALHNHSPLRYQVSRRAATAFLEQHLGRWIEALVRALAEHQARAPYPALAALLEALLREQCGRLGIAPRLAESRLPYDIMQAESFECPQAP